MNCRADTKPTVVGSEFHFVFWRGSAMLTCSNIVKQLKVKSIKRTLKPRSRQSTLTERFQEVNLSC